MYKYNNKEKLILPRIEIPNISFNEELISHLNPIEKEWVLNFINSIKSKNPNWNFNVLYSNLPTLTFKKSNPIYSIAPNSYNIKTNIVHYSSKSVIFHELLHASTSIQTNNRYLIGFEQIKKTIFHPYIGKGLTEGYTNSLEGKYDKTYGWYITEMEIAKNLNKSIPDMEEYYNNMDLLGLITFLEKYVRKDETLNFLEMLDFIYKYSFTKNTKIIKEIINLYYECQLYNFKCMITKLLQDITNKIVTLEEAQKQLTTMILLSTNKILIGKNLHEVSLIEKLKNQIPNLERISKDNIKTYKLEL